MTAVEKAKELFDKMKSSLFSDGEYDAKQCALIAVDEILETSPKEWTGFEYESKLEFWQEVKQELLKL